MNEFSLINDYFLPVGSNREEVILGIGDDAACLRIPENTDLLVSTDTLLSNVHFHKNWNPFDIAWKSVMVNVSDIAAMGGTPFAVTLSLTLENADKSWLESFSKGLNVALKAYNIALIGGDTVCGPLSITLTIHGRVPKGKLILRSGGKEGDGVWTSGRLGAAALAVFLWENDKVDLGDRAFIEDKLKHPVPRVDLTSILQKFASSAIDISDGLSQDLAHLCQSAHLGAHLFEKDIPLEPLLSRYVKDPLSLALTGGDDYELLFTVPIEKENDFKEVLNKNGKTCYKIGFLTKEKELLMTHQDGIIKPLLKGGYLHFK